MRSELAQRHKGDLDCALAELCALKDQAMRDAAVLWSEERNKLTEQVSTVKLETEGISEQKGGGGGGMLCEIEVFLKQTVLDYISDGETGDCSV